jgi:deoxynucleoside triphosphate triphosphohydrolase SAMHD1
LNVKIYLHQKVRAAESQLSTYLEIISKLPVLQEVHNWLKLPEAVIEYPEVILKEITKDSKTSLYDSIDNIRVDIKNTNFKKIDDRNLYFRAFAFGPINSLSEKATDSTIDAQNSVAEIENFFGRFRENDLKTSIIKEAKIISKILKLDIDENLLDKIVIDLPRLINIQQGQESIYFERPKHVPLKWTIPIDRIVIYFQENRALAYVFAPKEIAELMTLASEKVIYEKFGKKFNQEGSISSTTFKKVSNLKKSLTSLSYYEKLPPLKEDSDYLKSADAHGRIVEINNKLKSFKNGTITIERITTFVNQFPENLQEACLCLMNQLEVYDSEVLDEAINETLERNEIQNVGISFLGGTFDSANRMTYDLRPTIKDDYHLEVEAMSDAFVLKHDKIILFDDNINSGLQLLTIFADILGERDNLPPEFKLQEDEHNSPLTTDDAKNKFKDMPIDIIYMVGFEGIELKVKALLEKYLGFRQENINIIIKKKFKESEKTFSGENSKFQHSMKRELKAFLEEKGEQLLRKEGKSQEKIDACKLGYAKAEALVLFPYNVPTMTITAFWHSPKETRNTEAELEGGETWIPLAERRRRRSKDGGIVDDDCIIQSIEIGETVESA